IGDRRGTLRAVSVRLHELQQAAASLDPRRLADRVMGLAASSRWTATAWRPQPITAYRSLENPGQPSQEPAGARVIIVSDFQLELQRRSRGRQRSGVYGSPGSSLP